MRYIITERQYNLLSEQSMTGWGSYVPRNQQVNVIKGMNAVFGHNLNTLIGLASIFVPVIGPVIAASVGAVDAAMYWSEGNKKTAALVAIFSVLPFALKTLQLIPEVQQLGVKGMSVMAEKLLKNASLTSTEAKIVQKMSQNQKVIVSEVDAITKLLKPVESTIVKMKPQYIKKFGEQKYNVLLGQYLSGQINQKRFTTELSK